jgi:hypothetical protein
MLQNGPIAESALPDGRFGLLPRTFPASRVSGRQDHAGIATACAPCIPDAIPERRA